ncbi:MAG: type I glyceraldehyde-3-phosphate dehydrogenase [Nitrospinae bacterium]|nr:type I glyceraldehyde-3-phosphate dehydrogenase [Nitrospinota bacterium]
MSMKVGINGVGRIGRAVIKNILKDSECKDIEIAAINDLTDPASLAHLLQYDSVQGVFPQEVTSVSDAISIDGKRIKVLSEREPSKLPWKELGVDIVIESTGFFTNREAAKQHLDAGANKVIISAPAKNPDVTVVLGVNQQAYLPKEHNIISNASCTTNCLAPVVKVLHDNFVIQKGLMTTIHSYTNDQRILDLPHSDLRRARAANLSMIPTTTGAAKALSLVLPEIEGRLDGMSIRVPTPNVSLIDLVVEVEKTTSAEEVNAVFQKAAEGGLDKILRVEDKPLVSIDYNGDPYSAIVDSLSTKVMKDNMVKVLAWYDNEWGYSNRVKDLLKFIVSKQVS